MIIPARSTPSITAATVDLKSISRILAASVPVHAPVPGSGMPTNKSNAINVPLPAFSCNFFPPFSPFSRQNEKNYQLNSCSCGLFLFGYGHYFFLQAKVVNNKNGGLSSPHYSSCLGQKFLRNCSFPSFFLNLFIDIPLLPNRQNVVG